jgi:MFS family permease
VPRKPLTPRGIAYAVMFGTAVEGYEFILYTFASAIVFGTLFFPGLSPWLGTLAAIATHGVAFIVRPVGAILFGRVGDRYGRRPALIASIALMGVATTTIGLLPTYAAIGVAAPTLLVLFRLLQGLSLGGEFPGAIVVGVEHAPPGRRTLYGAFPQIGGALGILLVGLSLLVVNLLAGSRGFASWGWRVPFLLSLVLVLLGIMLRSRLTETPEFVAASTRVAREQAGAGQLNTLFRTARAGLGIGTLMWIGPATFAYAFLTSLLAYTKSFVPTISPTQVQLGLVLTAILLVFLIAGAAVYGGRWGTDRSVILAGGWMVLWAAPSYWLVNRGTLGGLLAAMLVGAVSYGIFSGVGPALTADLFPVEVRYVGVAISLTLGAVVGGGLFPVAALALVGANNGSVVPLVGMVMIGGLCTTVGGMIALQTRGTRAGAGVLAAQRSAP